MIKWTTITRRTNDPKLEWFEQHLHSLGIKTQRDGDSWHAPIMQVKESDADRVWSMLSEKMVGDDRIFDEIPDDDPMFGIDPIDDWDNWELDVRG